MGSPPRIRPLALESLPHLGRPRRLARGERHQRSIGGFSLLPDGVFLIAIPFGSRGHAPFPFGKPARSST
jgi:hypothetical protein